MLTTLVLATTFTPIKGRLEKFTAERLREPDEAQPATGSPPALDLDDPAVQAFAARVAEMVRAELEPAATPTPRSRDRGRRSVSTDAPRPATDDRHR